MKSLKYFGWIIIIIISFIFSFYFYADLPSQIATHWDLNNNVNGYMSKSIGTFIIPLISLFIFGLFTYIPRIDPLKSNIQKFKNHYERFIIVIILFLNIIHSQVIAWNLGYKMKLNFTMPIMLAILFYSTGTLLEHSKRNWFIGIRTPWTLSNDNVWYKTNKLGSKLFKASAIIMLLGFIWPLQLIWFILIPILLSVIITFAYSYFIFKK